MYSMIIILKLKTKKKNTFPSTFSWKNNNEVHDFVVPIENTSNNFRF